jgi:uncharacterized protein (DUF58 family)
LTIYWTEWKFLRKKGSDMYIGRLIIVTLIIFFIQYILFRNFGCKGIYYKRYFSRESVFEGDKVFLIEEIYNAKILPAPWLIVESKISGALVFGDTENLRTRHEGLYKSIFSLYPYTRIIRKHTVLCTKRGEYIPCNVNITNGSLFGGGTRTFEVETKCRLVVYPKIRSLRELPVKHHNIFGDILMKRWILKDPFLVAGTNEYTYNEPLNLINWKATARSNSIRVNNLDFSSEHKIMVLMNIDLSQDQWTSPPGPEIVEALIQITASFVYKSLGTGIETGFGTNACCNFNEEIGIIRPGTGNEHLYAILGNMARIRLQRHLSFYTYLKNEVENIKANYDYLIVSWYDSDEIQKYVKMLINKGNSVFMFTGKDMRITEDI